MIWIQIEEWDIQYFSFQDPIIWLKSSHGRSYKLLSPHSMFHSLFRTMWDTILLTNHIVYFLRLDKGSELSYKDALRMVTIPPFIIVIVSKVHMNGIMLDLYLRASTHIIYIYI